MVKLRIQTIDGNTIYIDNLNNKQEALDIVNKIVADGEYTRCSSFNHYSYTTIVPYHAITSFYITEQ